MYFIEFERWETQNLFLSSFFLLNFNLSITVVMMEINETSNDVQLDCKKGL